MLKVGERLGKIGRSKESKKGKESEREGEKLKVVAHQ
jgi:hypothetical protein